MKLLDLLSTGKQIRALQKSEIPSLLGEIETLKAKLWVRLNDFEDLGSVIVFAKKSAKEGI